MRAPEAGRRPGRVPLPGRPTLHLRYRDGITLRNREMPRPLIAITATSRRESHSDPERVRLNGAYVDAVVRAGGIPLISPPAPAESASDVISRADAVLLTGGEDVEPALYGEGTHPALGRITPGRDVWEIALAREARTRRIPILGVCRGIQLLNVAFGGALIQDIPSQHPSGIEHEQGGSRAARTHDVRVVPNSRLASILGGDAHVNSIHHQAVATVAEGFTITASAPDGIVEGMEWTADDWWCVGVQWHPEELDGADRRLFAALVDAARLRTP